jgi:hypothetical protein
MSSYEPFSKRQARLTRSDQPIVWQYDEIPRTFRQQVVYILMRGLYLSSSRYTNTPVWENLHAYVAEEEGLARLSSNTKSLAAEACDYLLLCSPRQALDFIEIAFRFAMLTAQIDRYEKKNYGITDTPEEAIETLNRRFREHSLGYQFVEGQLIRVDSEYAHAEIVEPAIALLHEANFTGPNDEFLQAHKHYREGNYKDALNNALKAFESTMKAICDKRKWSYSNGPTASQLIDVILKNELIPTHLQQHFTAFQSVLKAGLPTVRNKMGGHGQGGEPVEVPDYFAAFALHTAASNIVLLVQAHKARP